MKIALLGYGKMGKTIEEIALERGHKITLKVDEDIDSYDLTHLDADVAIDFSIPQAAFKNITTCFELGIPVVCGTTGWLDHYDKAIEVCEKHNSAFLYASNFSIGVNLFFELNEKLAQMMKNLKEYAISVEEIHHVQKLDSPSGTAISLAQQIITNNPNKIAWQLDHAENDEIPIYAKREAEVPGTHTVSYDSEIDSIEIKHTAHSRQGFAQGAVIAAEWLKGKEGIYRMQDVLAEILK
ncbi:4-hydroxy-tetrahydrodipicolinate reductase [Salegentibacter sp. F14]